MGLRWISDLVGTKLSSWKFGSATLVASGLSASRSLIVPDKDGTLATLSDIPGSLAWAGKICAAYGNGDPDVLLGMVWNDGSVAATPTNIGTTQARCIFFRPAENLTVNRIRFFGVGATTSIYQCALYSVPTFGGNMTRLTAQLAITTAANTWGSVATGGVTLTARSLYLMALSVNTTGTVAGIACVGPSLAATTGFIGSSPPGYNGTPLAGNLNPNNGFVYNYYMTAIITGGALPTPWQPATSGTATTGGFPAFWLDNDTSA